MQRDCFRVLALLAVAICVASCADRPTPQQHREEEWHAPIGIIRAYADKDGKLTRAELEAGLRRDFDAADLNHNGVLDPDEIRLVNQKRWREDQSAASPLVDWNGDGVVDFDEFAATARTLFSELDRNGNGVLTPDELRKAASPEAQPSGQEQQPQGGHRGPRGGGGEGPPG